MNLQGFNNDKAVVISLITIILFNIFFMIILIFHNDIIIIVNGFFKPITREYYDWFLDQRISVKNEDIISAFSDFFKLLFSSILLLEFFYIIFNEKYINVIGKKATVISLFIGFISYSLCFLFIKYKAEHYRLFMTNISTEVLSLVLLSLIIKYKRKMCKNIDCY